tara:strand:+ start:2864 stop:2992 length:129 start_codon:yes stop_codon:yes gene_type:complete
MEHSIERKKVPASFSDMQRNKKALVSRAFLLRCISEKEAGTF